MGASPCRRSFFLPLNLDVSDTTIDQHISHLNTTMNEFLAISSHAHRPQGAFIEFLTSCRMFWSSVMFAVANWTGVWTRHTSLQNHR